MPRGVSPDPTMNERIAWLGPSFIASLLAVAAPSDAHADDVSGTRSEKVDEREHDIRLVLEHGVATLRVRRTVFNGGPRHDQAVFSIDVPEGAVATGLRTQGTLHGRPHWFDGDLLEAEMAASRYRELTGIGGYYPKDPALLSWRSPTELVLQVFPVAPASKKTVEYTFSMPTRYEDGRDHVELPSLGTAERFARVTLLPGHARDQLFVDGTPVGRGTPLVLDSAHTIALARHRAPRIEAHLASVPFADERVLMHYDVALAPTISTIPKDARVVVVLDGSRSLSSGERDAARNTARAYLQHFVDPRLRARAEVIVFDHEIEARHGKLVSARQARADLQHIDLAGYNGSRVDEALATAGDLLRRGPAGPRRIVLLTDARTRDGLQPTRLEALAERSGATVHVGIVSAGQPSLERDDDHEWAQVATATGGLVWTVAADPFEVTPEAEAIFEELARPLRLDHLEIALPPLDDPLHFIPEQLPEGSGEHELLIVEQGVDHLRVSGELWSEPVHETVFADADQGRRWAALVFGDDLREDLTEEEMMPLALLGGAVSPVTSYLAIEPGVRPSTEGLDWGSGTGSFGSGGLGLIGTGRAGSGMGGGSDDRQEFLEQEVRAGLAACGGQGSAVRVTLESTLEEIVEINGVTIPDAKDPVLEPCLEKEVWAIVLPPEFADQWRAWTVDLPAA